MVNTGREAGVNVLLERGMARFVLLRFPCWHHVLELVLGTVIHARWPTSGRCDAIFTHFPYEWPHIVVKMPVIVTKAMEKASILDLEHYKDYYVNLAI